MTPNDLIDDLRSRINPAYAHQLGTESYERRLCVEALEAQAAEIERLQGACAYAATIFRQYEAIHAAKPDPDKAARNALHAERMERALLPHNAEMTDSQESCPS